MTADAKEKRTPRAIFLAVRQAATPDERLQLLDEMCAGQRDLRQQVEEMLNAAQSTQTNPLDRLGAMLNATKDWRSDSMPDLEKHPLIGPYKLLELLGEGGMGVVYLAQQEQPIRRLVAVKLIKPGMDSNQVVSRFESERQTLAVMNHPNIAKVLDAGASSSGSPYFVMELVRGKPMMEYCDHHNLGVRERLELFTSVCDAVHHAHQKGIIHRDLKPSNILVELDDVRSIPKVIDFGVAKSMHPSLCDSTLVTGLSQMIGTPLYMSPEQAHLNSFDVDTRSDVYSLGVVLYELLTGGLPFELETLKKVGLDEFRRVIREDEPPRPSTRISTLENKRASTVSETRQTDLKHLSLVMKRELDWIVLKALEKDRKRRYQSADDFSDDIKRFLNDEQVLACPPNWRYRTGKWAKRRKGYLSAGILLMAAACIFSLLLWNERSSTMAALVGEREQRLVANQQRQMAKDQEQLALQREAETEESRRLAIKNQYNAEIVSGQVDWQRGYLKRLESKLQGHLPFGDQKDWRGWEWYYLWALGHPEVRTMTASVGQTFAVWSPDGRYIGSSGDIWEAETGKSLRQFEPAFNLRYRSAWSPDSQYFAWCTASDDSCVYLWDRVTDELHELREHKESVWCLGWSPDSKQLVTGGIDKTLHIWDVERRIVVRSLQAPDSASDVAFSPDGQLITACISPKGVLVWQADSGKLVTELSVENTGNPNHIQLSWHSGAQQLAVSTPEEWFLFRRDNWSLTRKQKLPFQQGRDVVWSPDGRKLAVADGQVISLWNPSAAESDRTLTGHTAPILNVDWSPTSQQLVSSDSLGSVKIWDLNSSRNPIVSSLDAQLQSLVWTDDNSGLMFEHTDGATSTLNLQHVGQIDRSASTEFDGESLWSPDRTRVARHTDKDALEVRIHSGKDGGVHSVCRLESEGKISQIVWSDDGKKLAIAQQSEKRVSVTMWDVDSEQRISKWSYVGPVGVGKNAGIYPIKLVWSPDHKNLAIGSWGEEGDNGTAIWQGHIYVVNVQSGANVLKHNVGGMSHHADIRAIAWRPDGQAFVSGTHLGLIEAILINSGVAIFSHSINGDSIRSLSWNQDGDRIAAAADDGSVKVLDANSGADLLTFSVEGKPYYVSWSPNGRRLAAATQTGQVQVWDASRAYQWAENKERRGELARSYAEPRSGTTSSENKARLQEVLNQAPDTLDSWMLRGNVRASLGDFEGAAAEYSKIINSSRNRSVIATKNYGISLLASGQIEAFREHCRAMFKDLKGSAQSPSIKRTFISLYMLIPRLNIDAEVPIEIGRDFVKSYGASNASAKLVLGTCLYRAGKFQEAADILAEAATQLERQGNPQEQPDLVSAMSVLAMTRHQLGHYFQASRLLDQSLQIAQKLPRNIRWSILVPQQILQKEACVLIRDGPIVGEEQKSKAIK